MGIFQYQFESSHNSKYFKLDVMLLMLADSRNTLYILFINSFKIIAYDYTNSYHPKSITLLHF